MLWWDHGMNGWGYAGMAIGMALFWTLIVASPGERGVNRSTNSDSPLFGPSRATVRA